VAARLWQLPGADAYRAKFARWLAASGASTTDVDTFSGLPARALALIPRAMQPHADRVDTELATAAAFDAAGCRYQWARTRILTGGEHAATGAAARARRRCGRGARGFP
jgi:hypothetical protein